MNRKLAIYLPALAITATVTLTQLGVFKSFAETPISSPITGPIESPTPTPTPDTNTGSGSSNSDSGSSGSSGPAVCNDAKPSSAPKLLSAVSKKPNQVILTWSKATDPVTYYLVSYGTNSMANQYGNPNVGDKNTTSYTISGLSGNTTYYFRVRAGNGCTPGDFSNVLSAKANGRAVSQPAVGFKAGVLGTKVSKPKVSPAPTSTPAPQGNQGGNNVIQRIFGFLFSH